MPNLELIPQFILVYVNVTQTGRPWGKRSQDSVSKSGSWPNWEAIFLGVLVRSFWNYPLTSLFEAFYSPSKSASLILSTAHHDAFALRQGSRSERV